jgi:hypothetical protein
MTTARDRVVMAAVALCRAGRGFIYMDSGVIFSRALAKRLEDAVAALPKAERKRKKRK